MRRPARIVLAIAALFGVALAATPALAQSNIQAGTPLVPSITQPLSLGGSNTTSSTRTLTPLALPAAAPSAAAPGAPAALSTTSALPLLAAAPAVVAGGTVPVPQSTFTCSCFGVGFGTRWVGRVQSTSFLSASNAAAAQCNSYAANSGTQSPYIPPSGGVSLGRNPYPSVNPNGVPGNAATGFRGTTVFTETSAAQTGAYPRSAGCARCACD